ncbi:MAG TPA: serine hydrolase domain-containing protein [Candidatus Acidoferrum sp.]|nr:serine hydrolase domain-containing protein [Candidatus Acidoferrum sp.]
MRTKYFSTYRARNCAAAIALFAGGFLAQGFFPEARGQATSQATSQAKAAAATATGKYAQAKEHARRQGREWLARGITGVTLAVAVDGQIVYAEGFGYADVEQKVPVWPATKFRIASDSKPLTAAGLMLLVEQGKVDLDAPVQKYVPSFPEKTGKITPRLLAGHLAGIRHYQGDEFQISRHYDSVSEGLKIFANDPLVSPPGKEFHYSSYGFNLLSAVIESASGENFLTYMHDRVFVPLGLRHTTADQPGEIIEQRARPYRRGEDGVLHNAPYVDNSYKWAGGGFLSTAEDLAMFGSALLQPGFLKTDSLRALFTSQKTSDGKETGYGIGWFTGRSQSGQKIYAHDGGAVGGSSRLILYPDAHVVVAMICNYEGGWKAEEVESVGEMFEAK